MNECSICLEDLEGTIVILTCQHKYHDLCIGKWFEKNTTCPQCNIETDIETIIDINQLENESNNLSTSCEMNGYESIKTNSATIESPKKNKCHKCTIL
jgi:hypothetical protein